RAVRRPLPGDRSTGRGARRLRAVAHAEPRALSRDRGRGACRGPCRERRDRPEVLRAAARAREARGRNAAGGRAGARLPRPRGSTGRRKVAPPRPRYPLPFEGYPLLLEAESIAPLDEIEQTLDLARAEVEI